MSPADGPEVPADLLAGLSGRDLQARHDLVADLLAQGHSIDEIRRSARGNRLALLPVETILRGTPTLSTVELVTRTGVDPELLERALQASGIPIPEQHEPVWDERDLSIGALLAALSNAGIDDEAIVELARTLGEATARIGAAAIISLGSGLTREGDTEHDLAVRIADTAGPVNAQLADAIGLLVRAHAVNQLTAVRLDSEQVAEGRIAGATPITIAFADVVGFTRMGEELGAQRLRDVAARLGELGAEVSAGDVRVIKTIGDAVMLAGPRPQAVVAAMLALQERVAEEDFPRIRAGVATGDAVPRAGDWFGPPVNRAARVCATARPESVLTDDVTRQRIGDRDGIVWSGIGRVRLKGVGRVALYRARIGDDGLWRAGVHSD